MFIYDYKKFKCRLTPTDFNKINLKQNMQHSKEQKPLRLSTLCLYNSAGVVPLLSDDSEFEFDILELYLIVTIILVFHFLKHEIIFKFML